MTSALFSPIRLADLALDNRIVVAPMCQYSSDDGVASDWHVSHLGMLANSGAGLVIIEATHVERHGRITQELQGRETVVSYWPDRGYVGADRFALRYPARNVALPYRVAVLP